MSVPWSELDPPAPPLPQASVYSLRNQRGRGGGGLVAHSPAGERVWSPNSDDWRKSLVLCLLCGIQALSFPFDTLEYRQLFNPDLMIQYPAKSTIQFPPRIVWDGLGLRLTLNVQSTLSTQWYTGSIFSFCSATAATNYPSLRNSPNDCQGHLRPCLSLQDHSMVTVPDSNDVPTRSDFIQL